MGCGLVPQHFYQLRMYFVVMLEENLAKLGFSPSEVKVYLHLLKKQSSYANRISSETGINRTNVYEALDRLSSKGVACFVTRNKVKWFEAKPPNVLCALIQEKEDELRETKENLLNDIIKIKKATALQKEQLEAGIFVGKNGLRMLFEEMIETAKPISLIASKYQFKSLFKHYFEQWHSKRIAKGIKQRSIFPKRFQGIAEKRKLLQFKFVEDRYTSPTSTFIYDDSCIFIQWSKQPFAVRIQNKEIAKSHQNYFNMLWKS